MLKAEIIKMTLKAMSGKFGLEINNAEAGSDDPKDAYDLSITIPTLIDRLPEGDTKICADFQFLGVECCEICHNLYPHYEMILEDLADGGKVWICCSLRRAMRGDPPVQDTDEEVDLEEALGGGIRDRERAADVDESDE